MPEESEVETKELQEAIEELHEKEAEEKKNSWTRYVGLSTAILAVFAAIGALQANSLSNEAVINRVKASDTWNEFQSSREKSHLYGIALNGLVDLRAANGPPAGAKSKRVYPKGFKPETPGQRIHDYANEIEKEQLKSKSLSENAKRLEKESEEQSSHHERFAYSVALIQVAIALGAVSALTKVKYVWYLSLLSGAVGVGLFLLGFAR